MLNHRSLNGAMHYTGLILEKGSKMKVEEEAFKFRVKVFTFNRSRFGLEKERLTVTFEVKSTWENFASTLK